MEYNGQKADWRNSVVVFAVSREDALIKVMKYHQGLLEKVDVAHGGEIIEVIA
ncbi:hypothetical protein [Acetonema longum]|uniref:Uncharacterized protein n=1 Tax=Acetonema longum DSM 6540 TaxID=1009370 RepID=F7NJ53_9FIRM|nr:hypothetical protein [Acetonema longum]EGO63943.1 hypothetical protein ALO_10544 [Acetonema longum DSM 6540]